MVLSRILLSSHVFDVPEVEVGFSNLEPPGQMDDSFVCGRIPFHYHLVKKNLKPPVFVTFCGFSPRNLKV